MKKLNILIIVFSLTGISLQAQNLFETHTTTRVGPGMVYKHITVPSRLWNINVLEIDLTNPYVIMETMKANDRLSGYETTSSMAARKNAPGHEVVGAVNGDFYGTGGVPLNTQVVNGQILQNPITWPVLSFDFQNYPTLDPVNFSGSLIVGNQIQSVTGINRERGTDQLIIYNSFYGASTGTNIYGTEVKVSVLDNWYVNDTLQCRVTDKSNSGDMSLSAGIAVLSGHGTASTFLQNNVQVGDTIKLLLNLLPGPLKLTQLVGGNLKIVENGAYTGSSNTDVHPRTTAGFSADHHTLYLATVDGRVPGTYTGMSYRELAELMIYLGADEAVNLDGGGSSTMVVHGEIKNHPSDGPERAVANSLLTVSGAPPGSGITSIQVEPDNQRVFLKNSIQLRVTGWDEYFHPVAVNQADLQYIIDPHLGQVDSSGKLTVGAEPDSGWVHVNYHNLTDSAWIFIKGIKSIEILPKSVITDTIQAVQYIVIPTDVDDLHPVIALNDYEWFCLNPAVGTIDTTGKFKGIAEGQTQIVAKFIDQTDTAIVKVEIGKDMVVLDSLDDVNNWSVSGVLYDPQGTSLSIVDTPRTVGSGALRLNYRFIRSSQGRSWVYLNTDQAIYGLPDTLLIDIKSNNLNHIADIIISDDNGELFTASTGLFSTSSTTFETYKIPISSFNAVDPSSSFNFPIRFKSIQIKLWYVGAVGDTNTGTLYFDNLRVKYPTSTTAIPDNRQEVPQRYNLLQNYPNPFNPNTTIQYDIPQTELVRLEIYDVLGQKVAILVNERQNAGIYKIDFIADHLASGIYFYRLQAGNQILMRKMILLR
jgi:hypothetical protein